MVKNKVYVEYPLSKIVCIFLFLLFLGCILFSLFFSDKNFFTIVLFVMFFFFLLSLSLVFFQSEQSFLLSIPISLFMPFFSPIFMCVFSMSLMPNDGGGIIRNVPLVVLFYCFFITVLEFYLIDWSAVSRKKIDEIFKIKRGVLFIKKGGSVLEFSPFRNDNSWLFSGKFRFFQKIIIGLFFLYLIYVFSLKSSVENLDSLALAFCFIGCMAQPLLLEIAIKVRLAFMKQRGDI